MQGNDDLLRRDKIRTVDPKAPFCPVDHMDEGEGAGVLRIAGPRRQTEGIDGAVRFLRGVPVKFGHFPGGPVPVLEEGKLDLIIGTHALLGKKIKFKDLGLLIIDEEQKFGVAAKEKLRKIKVNVDTLTLTATPIPRTLQFSLMAARDLSLIKTPPPNRQPIHTERRTFSDNLIKIGRAHV